jgi:hypothetical protein
LNFTLFKGAQTASQSKQTGFANPIVSLQMQPLPGLQRKRNTRKKAFITAGARKIGDAEHVAESSQIRPIQN